MTAERHYAWFELEHPGTTAVPAVRTVVLKVGVQGEESWTDIEPVLALYVRLVDTYERRGAKDHSTYATAEEAKEAGYEFSHRDVKTSCLISNWEMGIIPHDSLYNQSSNTSSRVFACPWPQSEDAERLKEHAEDMIKDLREFMACRHKKETASVA